MHDFSFQFSVKNSSKTRYVLFLFAKNESKIETQKFEDRENDLSSNVVFLRVTAKKVFFFSQNSTQLTSINIDT